MNDDYSKGIAFILEGDTEKVFYLSLLNHYCNKYSEVIFSKHRDANSGETFYTLEKGNNQVLLMFNVVGTVSQITNSSSWFENRCYGKHKRIKWTVFLCYDTDNYTPNISKFYEGDWKDLRKAIQKHKSCSIIDLAASADIEDIFLIDLDGIFKYLNMTPIPVPAGSKGKMKLKKIFRAKGRGVAYHEGERAKDLINSLNLDKIISLSPVPLTQVQSECFTVFCN